MVWCYTGDRSRGSELTDELPGCPVQDSRNCLVLIVTAALIPTPMSEAEALGALVVLYWSYWSFNEQSTAATNVACPDPLRL